MIERDLLEKYNTAVPRYTSYPPANFFNADFSVDDYEKFLAASNHETPENISIYIHTPFCPRLCFYCGCNTTITRNQHTIASYMEALKKEISMVAPLLDKTRRVSQIHWGGGTPNALGTKIIQSVMDLIRREFKFTDHPEIAMECSPAYLTKDYIDDLIAMGFNRFSLGIQDFKSDVLKAVNRAEPALPVVDIMEHIRKKSSAGINLDFIYGLPLQTVQSFGETIAEAAGLKPERLVTFSYAHVPWFKQSQKNLEKYGLPDADEKLQMFEAGYEIMTGKGYKQIGLDHFARPDDELSLSLENKKLHRNFQGYCTRETTGQVYAFGTSSISQLHSAYVQNTKEVPAYMNAINAGTFAVVKGYKLREEQIVVREVVNEIMCNRYLSWTALASRLGVDREQAMKMTEENETELKGFESDGLIVKNQDGLEVTDKGRFFIRNIAASYDPMLKAGQKNFSKSI